MFGETSTGSYRTDTDESVATSMIGSVAQADNHKSKNTVVIRNADLTKDALSIMDGARDFASRVSFKSLFPQSDEEFVATVGRIITIPGVEILLAEFKGLIVGGIAISYGPYLWNPKLTAGEEIFWWAAKDAPFRTGHMLGNEAMRRIDERKAIPFFKSLETSPKGVRKMYDRRGLKPIETTFARI